MRPDNYIRIGRHIGIPAPLADVLSAIGSYQSVSSGALWVPDIPSRPTPVPTFWTVDAAIVDRFIQTIAQLQHGYMMREYPSPTDTTGRPFISTRLITDGDLVRVKVHNQETTPAEVFLRVVAGDFLSGQPDNMTHCNAMDFIDPRALIGTYLRGYVMNPFRNT